MNVKYIFFDKFYVAGATYSCDFDRVIDEIPLGAEVCFKREPDNDRDKKALAVYYKGYKLGYVPRACNLKYDRLFDRGLTEIFHATVASIDRKTHSKEQALEITVSLRLDGASRYSLTEREAKMIEDVKNLDLSSVFRAFGGLNKKGEFKMPTLGTLLAQRRADVAFTTIWELKDIERQYSYVPVGDREPIEVEIDGNNPDDFIGEYFTPMKKDDEYPLICVYLNRIDYYSKGDADRRCFTICETFIHECMHALFDHDPRQQLHPRDSYLEEPTCECGAIIIAQELDHLYPGFGDFVLKSVDGKKNKYGLGADLYRYWSSSQECMDNAVDAYNEACDFIGFNADGTVVNGWTGRMPHTQAIPQMKEIYWQAHRSGVSNRTDKPEY